MPDDTCNMMQTAGSADTMLCMSGLLFGTLYEVQVAHDSLIPWYILRQQYTRTSYVLLASNVGGDSFVAVRTQFPGTLYDLV